MEGIKILIHNKKPEENEEKKLVTLNDKMIMKVLLVLG